MNELGVVFQETHGNTQLPSRRNRSHLALVSTLFKAQSACINSQSVVRRAALAFLSYIYQSKGEPCGEHSLSTDQWCDWSGDPGCDLSGSWSTCMASDWCFRTLLYWSRNLLVLAATSAFILRFQSTKGQVHQSRKINYTELDSKTSYRSINSSEDTESSTSWSWMNSELFAA